MAGSPDLIEPLRTLNEESAEYLIVGGYAVMKYTEPRFTKDLGTGSKIRRKTPPECIALLPSLASPAERRAHCR